MAETQIITSPVSGVIVMPPPTRGEDQKLPPYRIDEMNVSMAMGEIVDWGLTMLGVPEVWKRTRGKGIRVGVADTGCPDHPDLEIAAAEDFTKSRSGVFDIQGHSCLHPDGVIYTSFCGLETIEKLYDRVESEPVEMQDGSLVKFLSDTPIYTLGMD